MILIRLIFPRFVSWLSWSSVCCALLGFHMQIQSLAGQCGHSLDTLSSSSCGSLLSMNVVSVGHGLVEVCGWGSLMFAYEGREVFQALSSNEGIWVAVLDLSLASMFA